MIALLGLIPATAAIIVAVDDPAGALVCLAYFGLLFFVIGILFHRSL